MKSVVLALCLLVGCAPVRVSLFPEPAQVDAYWAYIPIACDGRVVGTGFPVAPDLVMTAAHVICWPGQLMEVSLDHGVTWIETPEFFMNGAYDVGMILVDGNFTRIAQFRAPALGEATYGYGSAYGDEKNVIGFMVDGVVSQYTPDYVWVSNPPIGGMSGSAIFGSDGKVVGMVNHGHPDHRVGGSLSGGLSGNLLADLLQSFLEYRSGG